jgi:two-component system chemotaxis response regulator CheY
MPKKILVVEDTLDTRQMLHHYLKAEGYDVVTASDGREGLYMANSEKPDLIITDINMPEIDGIELIKKLRTQPEFKDLPIIALTAYGIDERDDTIRAGASRAADKPTDLDGLVSDIEEMLKEKK